MSAIPRERIIDSSLALLSEGYTFIGSRCQRFRSDIFATRLMLQPATCLLGEEAASCFYAGGRFTRHGAFPPTTLRLLQDLGSVNQLDGEAHHRRKQMFLSMMTPAHLDRFGDTLAELWNARLGAWESMSQVVLHDEMLKLLCRTGCVWAGIPISDRSARKRTREFTAMVEGAAKFGPRTISDLLLRARSERWARRVIERIRAGDRQPSAGSAAHIIAWWREPDGDLLEPEIAAVELLNILRPTTAVAYYVTFAALALHDYPAWRDKLRASENDLEPFVQEVRRFYPLFPLVGGRVRQPFDWRGHHFTTDAWVLLDLYGTNHDPRIWGDPGNFRPERFQDWNGSGFDLIPQGGGDHATDHRCPGEWATIELLKRAVTQLTTAMRYDVPPQDLTIDLSRMPAVPNSRFVITNVRRS